MLSSNIIQNLTDSPNYYVSACQSTLFYMEVYVLKVWIFIHQPCTCTQCLTSIKIICDALCCTYSSLRDTHCLQLLYNGLRITYIKWPTLNSGSFHLGSTCRSMYFVFNIKCNSSNSIYTCNVTLFPFRNPQYRLARVLCAPTLWKKGHRTIMTP